MKEEVLVGKKSVMLNEEMNQQAKKYNAMSERLLKISDWVWSIKSNQLFV